ncbi:hypothetical protein [Rhizobium leguminosarum]
MLRQGRGLLAISYFPSTEVKLMRKARPERKQAILDDVEVLERD